MTAVEFLISRIGVLIPDDIGSQLMFKSNVKKAIEMEKQQIIDALEYGWDNGHIHISILEDVEEKYYNKTYGNNSKQ